MIWRSSQPAQMLKEGRARESKIVVPRPSDVRPAKDLWSRELSSEDAAQSIQDSFAAIHVAATFNVVRSCGGRPDRGSWSF